MRTGTQTACRWLASPFAALLLAAGPPDPAHAAGRERRIDVEILADAPYGRWRRFDFAPPITDRYRSRDERANDELARQVVVRAFTQRGYEHATEGAVDFLIDVTFDPPAEPAPGAIRWSAGKNENWLEIRVRAPDDIMPLWRGRAYQVLRRKRNRRGDTDALIRFLAAAQAIAERFPPPPHQPPMADRSTAGADDTATDDGGGR